MHRVHDVSEVIFFSVYEFTSSKACRPGYICMCYECLRMCLCVAPMHCVCGQVCCVYAMSVLSNGYVLCICVCVPQSVWGLACSGHRLNCFHMCLNSECCVGKGNMSVCLSGGVGGWGGSGFIAPSTAFGPVNTKLKFPRLPAHTSQTVCVDTLHGNMAKHSLWQTHCNSE